MGLGIRREDTVVVLSGKEKGKKGRVISVIPAKERVIVERVNMIKKHMRPNQQYKQCSAPTRIANMKLEDGRKLRACKKCKEVMDQ